VIVDMQCERAEFDEPGGGSGCTLLLREVVEHGHLGAPTRNKVS
jgi:hypothetical protein